jgi:hypothetical protein
LRTLIADTIPEVVTVTIFMEGLCTGVARRSSVFTPPL